MTADLWPIKDKALIFDGRRHFHWTENYVGSRWAIVLYSPDLSFHDNFGSSETPASVMSYGHARTEELRQQPSVSTEVLAEVRTAEQMQARDALIQALRDATRWIRKAAQRSHTEKYGGGASCTMNFGVQRRRTPLHHFGEPRDKSKACPADQASPRLFAALHSYLDALLGAERVAQYSALFVAENSQCAKHLDKNNVGSSIILAVGDFTAGGLWVERQLRPAPCLMCKGTNRSRRVCREQLRHAHAEWHHDDSYHRAEEDS
jgi:hypothetical protein